MSKNQDISKFPMASSQLQTSRINQLQDKLKQFQLDTRSEREKYRTDVERAVRRIEENLHSQTSTNRAEFASLKQKFYDIYTAIQTQKTARELGDEKKTKEIKVVEAALLVDFNVERQRRKELEQKMHDLIQQREIELNEGLKAEAELREASNAEQRRFVQEQINQMLGDLDANKNERDAMLYEISVGMRKSAQDLKDRILEERKQRVEGTDQLYNYLTVIAQTLQQKLKTEREEREATEEGLMNLLEQTCRKIEEGM